VRVLRLIAVLVMLVSFAGCGSDDSDRDETSSGPPRTWVVRDGQTRTFSPDDLQANDIFRCSDNGAVSKGYLHQEKARVTAPASSSKLTWTARSRFNARPVLRGTCKSHDPAPPTG
jgi:hypothetical protein